VTGCFCFLNIFGHNIFQGLNEVDDLVVDGVKSESYRRKGGDKYERAGGFVIKIKENRTADDAEKISHEGQDEKYSFTSAHFFFP